VASTALEVIHLIIGGYGAKRVGEGIDAILYEALERMSLHRSSTSDALRQRKARCGPCVTELIRLSLEDMGIAS
jgi:hypothetical protein